MIRRVADVPVSSSRSLEEIHSTVPIPAAWWRRFLAVSGPALMGSVGYMDPGNWGTDLEAVSTYGYPLLWVLLLAHLLAHPLPPPPPRPALLARPAPAPSRP